MDRALINSYLINFRKFLSPYIKKDVSMKSVVYPYPNGAVILSTLSINESNNTEYSSDCASINDALARTNMIADSENATDVKETKIFIHKNSILLIKGDNANNWSAERSYKDANNIVNYLDGKRNG